MAYRGEDLDLRTPRNGRDNSSSTEYGLNGSRSRSTSSGSAAGYVVDETVLACCNHAFDIALAHGASEVRLEHLVHALTRVEAAADILEDRGIREAHLRRESAAVIASEIPVGLVHSSGSPRASYEFEDVLRRASSMADERNAVASVHDLLWVLLSYDHDNPAIALLRRHAANWQSWEWPHRREARGEVVREIVREVRMTEPPRRDLPPRRESVRYASEPRDDQRRRQTYQVERAAPQVIERVVQAPRNDEVLGRIDALEGSVHALMDMMRDLHGEVRESGGGGTVSVDVAPDAFIDHVRSVEAVFDDRLNALERAISGVASEGTRNWAQFGDRLKSIDKLAAGSNNSGLADLVTEQLVSVTDQVRANTERLAAIERTTEKREADQTRAWTGISDRLRSLDETLGNQKREIQQTLAASGSSGSNLTTLVSERFQSVRQQLDENRQDLATTMLSQVVEPVTSKMREVETAIDRRQQEGTRQLTGISERLVNFETLIKSQTDSVAKVSANHQRDLSEVHEALLKLGTNQKTLSDNLEQWRLESGGDLGIISNRLELLERGSGRPVELIEQMQADLANVTQLALADYDQNRRSVKTWLFGTNDVFSGSWRDETAAVRNRLREMRGGRAKA